MRRNFAAARQAATGLAVEGFFRVLSAGSKLHPKARAALESVEVIRDLPYRETGNEAHLLDVYRTRDAGSEPLPIVLHIHGGGFRILSKDTHWLMGVAFARRGFLVFNINYRLAPENPYPAAIEDACDAYQWVLDNAERFGGDVSRLFVAGESAGANLVTGLTVATSFARPERYAQAVFERDHQPIAAMPFCGLLQASDLARFEGQVPSLVSDRMTQIESAYLGGSITDERAFADPLVLLENDVAPDRPLPPFFAPVGGGDPILDDTRRLAQALGRRGVFCESTHYASEPHAFHAFVFRRNARQCWRDAFAFMDRTLREHS
ncbi:MAG: alpha/beta hydrolase [Myxococcota bacterium]